MSHQTITNKHLDEYNQNGYTIVRGMFTQPETDLLYKTALEDELVSKNAFDLNDQTGKKTKLTLWYNPGDDIYGLLARSRRVVQGVQTLLGGKDVCHYHSKLMQKEPRVGGAWEWHQDYGYWYKSGFLFPDAMISVMVALSEATIENGCLQVIKGSHKLGRVEHGFAGEQVGAKIEYVNACLNRMELVYVELQPGDVLFFHSNILHRSEANNSDRARWSMISAYNLSFNKPAFDENVSSITPITMVDDSSILAGKGSKLSEKSDFLQKQNDVALK